jgi:hypothetical protein
VLAPLADALNRHGLAVPLVARVRAPAGGADGADGHGIAVEVARRGPPGRGAADGERAGAGEPATAALESVLPFEPHPPGRPLPAATQCAAALRRLSARLADSAAFVAIENQREELRATLRWARAPDPEEGVERAGGWGWADADARESGRPGATSGWAAGAEGTAAARLAQVERLIDERARLAVLAEELEERLVLRGYEAWARHQAIDPTALSAAEAPLEALVDRLHALLLDLLRLPLARPDRVVLGCFAEDRDLGVRLAAAYLAWGKANGLEGRAFHLVRRAGPLPRERPSPGGGAGAGGGGTGGDAPGQLIQAVLVDDPARPYAPTGERPVAVGVEVSGPGAAVRLGAEGGLHRFRARERQDEQVVVVEVSDEPLERYAPSPDLLRKRPGDA